MDIIISRQYIALALILISPVSVFSMDPVGREMNKPPNVFMIVVHDLGQHLGCYGVGTVRSPNIDTLAARGIRFINFYSTSPVCSPGRGSLHTGRYPQSNGVMGLTHAPWWWSLNEGEKHTAQIIGETGYRTILAGFNHLGDPERLGYEEHLSRNNRAEETVSAVSRFFGQASKKDDPFFLKAGFIEVHRDFEYGSDSSRGIFVPPYLANTAVMRADLAEYQAEIHYFDSCVGRMLTALGESEVAENTLVVFTADHGIPYLGAKWSARRAGLTVPFICYMPHSVFSGGKVYTELMSNVDVLPTLLDFLGMEIPENVEGISFMGLISGTRMKAPREVVFGQYTPDMKRDNVSRTVISGKYQLIYYFSEGRSVRYPCNVDPKRVARHLERAETSGTRPFFQLYDIHSDPHELVDLGGQASYRDIVNELSRKLADWMRTVDDPLIHGAVPSPYYRKSIQTLFDP
jgi:N-sulfoglucosamine sulfohydrolase